MTSELQTTPSQRQQQQEVRMRSGRMRTKKCTTCMLVSSSGRAYQRPQPRTTGLVAAVAFASLLHLSTTSLTIFDKRKEFKLSDSWKSTCLARVLPRVHPTALRAIAHDTFKSIKTQGHSFDQQIQFESLQQFTESWARISANRSSKPASDAPGLAMVENCLAALPAAGGAQGPRLWDINGAGHPSVQGFSTRTSAEPGHEIGFKVRIRRQLDPGLWHGGRATPTQGVAAAAGATISSSMNPDSMRGSDSSSLYSPGLRMDVYRMGYYGGRGARLVASSWANASAVKQAESQPSCRREDATLLVDCGNWHYTFTWRVPAYAASGLYVARFVRTVRRKPAEEEPATSGPRAFSTPTGDSLDGLRTWRVDAAAGPLNPYFANLDWDYKQAPPCGTTPAAECLLRGMRNAGGARDTALGRHAEDSRGTVRGGMSVERLVEPVASHAYFVVREPPSWAETRARLQGPLGASDASWTDGAGNLAECGSVGRSDGSCGDTGVTRRELMVRDELLRATRPSNVLAQLSDVTWRAYNYYAGPNAYGMRPHERHRWYNVPGSSGSPECGGVHAQNGTSSARTNGTPGQHPPTDCPPAAFQDTSRRAHKMSLNSPLVVRDLRGINAPFGADYPAIRWLERSGYSVAYWSGVDTHCRGRQLVGVPRHSAYNATGDPVHMQPPQYSVFLSLGHDEYWSERQRRWVEQARDGTGMGIQMWSGNEVYWRVRWEAGTAGWYSSAQAGCNSLDVRDGPRWACPCEPTGSDGSRHSRGRESTVQSSESLACEIQGMQPPAPDDLGAHRGMPLDILASSTSAGAPNSVGRWYRTGALYGAEGGSSASARSVLSMEETCNPRTLVVFKETAALSRLDGVASRYPLLSSSGYPHEAEAGAVNSPHSEQHYGWTGTFRDDSYHRHEAQHNGTKESAASKDVPVDSKPGGVGGSVWMEGDPARPEQSLTGQSWRANAYRNDHLELGAADSKLAVWNGSDVQLGLGRACARQAGSHEDPGTQAKPCQLAGVLSKGLLGHEWDVDEDRAARPAGIARLSRTTVHSVLGLTDNGATFDTQSATHHLVMYRARGPPWMCQVLLEQLKYQGQALETGSDGSTRRFGLNYTSALDVGAWTERCSRFVPALGHAGAASSEPGQGALVFGAGTVQYSWGLSAVHDRPTGAPTFAESDVNARIGVDQDGADPSIQALTRNTLRMQGVTPWGASSASPLGAYLSLQGGRSMRPSSRVVAVAIYTSREGRSSAGLAPAALESWSLSSIPTAAELLYEARRSGVRAVAIASARAGGPARDVEQDAPQVAGLDVSLDGGSRWHGADRLGDMLSSSMPGIASKCAVRELASLATSVHPAIGQWHRDVHGSANDLERMCRNTTWLGHWAQAQPWPTNVSEEDSLWVVELSAAELAMDLLEMEDLEIRWADARGGRRVKSSNGANQGMHSDRYQRFSSGRDKLRTVLQQVIPYDGQAGYLYVDAATNTEERMPETGQPTLGPESALSSSNVLLAARSRAVDDRMMEESVAP